MRVSLEGPDGHRRDLPHLQDTFRRQQCVLLPQVLSPELFAWVQMQVSRTALTENRHGDDGTIASELAISKGTCLGLLTFLFNDPAVLRYVETVTHCPGLTRFIGRIYRRIPGTHFDSWHDDTMPGRMIGMSVNLSTEVYEGGEFEIRERASEQHLGTLANIGFGDAILFRISEDLQHRVAPLSGHAAKTAYAGWFGNTFDYNDELRRDPTLAGA